MTPSPAVQSILALTWKQSLKFFMLGLWWAVAASLLPVGVTLWDAINNWDSPIDWKQLIRLTIACAGPAAWGYWSKHKALLRLPPNLVIPPEFAPAAGGK